MPIEHTGMEILFDALDSRTDEAIKTLDDLVRIPTFVPPGDNYKKIMGTREKGHFGFNLFLRATVRARETAEVAGAG